MNTPSSGASRHLLPGGEKSLAATFVPSSPHRGEGGSPPGLAFGQPEDRLREPGEGAIVTIVAEQDADVAAREALLDAAMGPGRTRKSSEKIRRGRRPSEGLAFVARDEAGQVVGTVRLWDVAIGEKRALLLGPLAVDPSVKSAGIGSALMRHAISEAARLGHGAILLVGDAPYYARFGFSAEKTGNVAMPGPFEKHRLLAVELEAGAMDGARGVVRGVGRKLKAQPLVQVKLAA